MAMEEEGFAVGMDLGTTYCRVAVWKHNHVQVIEDASGKRMMASYVAFSSTQRFIGDAAESQAHMNITNTVYDWKRLIGRRFKDSSVQEDIKLLPFRVNSGPGDRPLIAVNYRGLEKQFTAEEICSMLLMKMKEKAETYLGATVKNVVVTVPSYFNDSQRQATRDAAAIAGLNVMRIINEPTAAAYAYAVDKEEGKRNILIFYLGGGTLDVSVMTMDGYTIKVRAVYGDTHLGGEDFDNRLVSHFIEELQRKHNTDISGNHKALRKLRGYCEKAKRNLSFLPRETFEIEALYEGMDFSFEITSEQFQNLNMDLFEKCIHAVKRCLQDAKMEASSIDDIVLVGGSTRIPMLQELLQDLFHKKELFKGINPDEAVVYGAAIQAAILNRQLNLNLVCEDVTPFSLSVLGHQIIPCNSTIPIDKKVSYTHNCDKTNGVFEVYETGCPLSTYNNVLCEFWLTRIPGKSFTFPICFEIDENGILKVSAEPTSGARITTEKGRLLEEEIEKMAKEAKEYQHQDEHYKKTMEARNGLEEFVYRIKNKVRNGRISSKDKEGIEKTLDSTTNWLHNNQGSEINEIESRKKEIGDLVNKVVENTAGNQNVGLLDGGKKMLRDFINNRSKTN